MKAWQIAKELYTSACPVIRTEEEQTWTDSVDVSVFYDENLSLDWGSNVPGSGAPEKIMVAAVQAMENRGYKVSEYGYQILQEGLKAHARRDYVTLHRKSALLRRELANAEKDPESPYWSYTAYTSFRQYEQAVTFPEAHPYEGSEAQLLEKLRIGWLTQMIGGAMGTMVEGYTSKNLYRAFGPVHDYLREPNTYNDDITFELAFLDAFGRKGYEVTSEDVALSWVGFIPCGWSAEELAIRNIKNGIFPPESGTFHNPFNEWIGAQMRAGVCGMAAPGDPYLAAKLAWTDAEVSHANNGILGEVFNAVMTSLAFVEKDIEKIVTTAMSLIPKDSEYYSVLAFAYDSCKRHADWHEALAECEKKYERYNWIHAYPNACNEIIALLYGAGDFAQTLHIITMCGVDADCNAGMIMPVVALRHSIEEIPAKYLHPAFAELHTYMRGRFRKLSLDELAEETLCSIQKAKEAL